MASYTKELNVAELAVQRASLLTDKVYHSRVKGTVMKEDKSPVTIADFGAQSAVIGAIAHAFPLDSIIGEEDADALRADKSTRDLVWNLVKDTMDESNNISNEIGLITGEEEMLQLIDRGNSEGGASGRIWALDPIDGTKGFLRGDQYAVCLGLMVDGQVTVAALGCPNLPVDPSNPEGAKGVLFSAIKGRGATSKPLSDPSGSEGQRIYMKNLSSPSEASFCEGIEAGHSSHSQQAAIASALGISRPPVRMDSQAKYGSIARADGDIYLRLPVSTTYEEKIWDHAAGCLIVEEAGGKVTDSNGKPLDFTQGRTLKANKGVVAAHKDLHKQVIAAVMSELKSSL